MVFFIVWVVQRNGHKLALFTYVIHIILPFCAIACHVPFAVQVPESYKSLFLQRLCCNFAQQSMTLITLCSRQDLEGMLCPYENCVDWFFFFLSSFLESK